MLNRKIISLLVFLIIPSLVLAGNNPTKEQVVTMVEKAAKAIKENREEAFKKINDKSDTSFHEGDLYVFVYDNNAVPIAHGAHLEWIGKSRLKLKDLNGKAFYQDFANVKDKDWIDYRQVTPDGKKYSEKSSYIVRVDDNTLVGAGMYK